MGYSPWCLLGFVAKTTIYPDSSLTSSEQSLRAERLPPDLSLQQVPRIRHDPQLLSCDFFSALIKIIYGAVLTSTVTLINILNSGLRSYSWLYPTKRAIV